MEQFFEREAEKRGWKLERGSLFAEFHSWTLIEDGNIVLDLIEDESGRSLFFTPTKEVLEIVESLSQIVGTFQRIGCGDLDIPQDLMKRVECLIHLNTSL